MAILNWRDHPRLRFVDFPPPFLTKGSVYIASDRNDSAWMSDGTTYYPLYGSGLEAPNLGVMTWAEKPAPNSVPAGTRFTASDFLMSDWQALNGYWTPVNGRVVVYAPDTTGVQAQSAVLVSVPGIPGWTIPADIESIPGVFIEGNCVCDVTAASAVQERQISIGPIEARGAVVDHKFTSAITTKRLWGRCHRISVGLWRSSGISTNPLTDAQMFNTTNPAHMITNPIILSYRGGNTDGSEILNVRSFSLSIGIG